MKNIGLYLLLIGSFITAVALMVQGQQADVRRLHQISTATESPVWDAPDTVFLHQDARGKQIRYGRELIANTALYLGPKGSVEHISNGMNCQNCHLNAGALAWGNNFSAVHATYPKMRARSGTMEDEYKRVNDCFERSLAGQALDSASAEMQAIIAYIDWLGSNVKKGVSPQGSGIHELPFMDRAADPAKGQVVYQAKCASCHSADGLGKMQDDGLAYQFPPLWGPHSYNEAAGLFRMSRFAGYVKDNMPLGATHEKPVLSDEEAWDVAAYVNSQLRPKHPFLASDWPDISGKPFDHPFGPYADPFPEAQHKYGPYGPIRKFKQEAKAQKAAERATQKTNPSLSIK